MGYRNAFRICGILCIFNFIIVTYNMTIIDASVFMTGAFFVLLTNISNGAKVQNVPVRE